MVDNIKLQSTISHVLYVALQLIAFMQHSVVAISDIQVHSNQL